MIEKLLFQVVKAMLVAQSESETYGEYRDNVSNGVNAKLEAFAYEDLADYLDAKRRYLRTGDISSAQEMLRISTRWSN